MAVQISTGLILTITLLLEGGTAMALTLATDGKADCVITIATDAEPPEVTAAQELKAHLDQVTGATFEIRDETAVPEDAAQIVVGPTPHFRAAFPDVDLASLKHDGIVIKTAGNRLYLAGGRPRGTLYAVYTFLEDTVGCRWWTSTESFMPNKPTLEIGEINMVYVPQLIYREAFYRDAFNGVFATRLKCNGHFERIPPEYGGHYTLLGWCHTFNQLLPPEKYFDNHPEWYSEINGKRVAERSQLCLTNDEMRAELVRVALEWIRKDPDAGMISISQNDWHGACQCANCRKVVEEEGSESGPIIRFVNAVAAEIEKEYPDFLIETLAYSYTRKPPALARPRKNVVVRLCSIECCFAQPLETDPHNEPYRRDMEGWSAISPQLYIWDYVTNFANYILPHPNLRSLAPNVRYFVANKAIGLFEQGDAGSSCGDFVELRAWLLAHLMWDPSRDEKALVAEFLRGYYGAAAEALSGYIDLIHDAAERSGAYVSCYMADTSAWLGLDDLNRAWELFAQAEKAVQGNPVLSDRVRRARLPLDHAWLQRQRALRQLAKMTGRTFLGPADPVALCEDFIATAQRFNVGQYAEGRPFENLVPALRAQSQPPGAAGKAPDIVQGLSPDDWIDIQESEFMLHNLGTWVTLEDDAKASNGRAARMPATHTQWAVQYPIAADWGNLGRWRCYIVARCDAKQVAGNAFQMGLYDTASRQGLAHITETLERASDEEYHTYDLGVHDLKAGMYLWVAPMNNPDAVDAVYVDRMFFVREK